MCLSTFLFGFAAGWLALTSIEKIIEGVNKRRSSLAKKVQGKAE